jgi:regulator of sigma E protease
VLILKNRKQLISPRLPFEIKVGKTENGSPAHSAGLQKEDVFVGVDTMKFAYYDEFTSYLGSKKGQKISLHLTRDGQPLTKELTVNDDGKIGFYVAQLNPNIFEYKTIEYGLLESVPAGINKGLRTATDYLKQFRVIFNKETEGYKALGGFATIGNIFPGTWDWYSFWNMTAFISIILAIMNLLPIPALDGGHVIFLLGEIITGRKPGEKFLEYSQITGMVLLLALVLYANANDIIKMINGTF